ncbi:DUF6155 family protein [Nostoc sphaeroides]|uniref:Uncharacterized protein n=1 Tax=Nostoc sphaeroides CCNUC1 TaxID=2653204 RepID=A0A5P8WG29_9NOSO|nr:DUF6155 family protein [Nostoc sphaeroides]MCC5632890.1 DUF6155 family protein [Nostoc sphaeroides CHAB 2801]QFS51560.1 hypothetical protein GXM_09054 [Nostoc sphaeroides CCNUC1]
MTQQKINVTELKQYLNNRSQEELISEISELFKIFPSVKDYYQIKLYPQESKEIAARYKKIIEEEFFPSRGLGKARLSVAKKAISDYKKLCRTEVELIDIMLFFVEQGVKFTDAYGDIDERFYLSMEGIYEQVVVLIAKSKLSAEFQQRCQKIVENTSEIGWGFHDTLSEIYEEAF